jgi:hypothetical protein
MKIKDPKSARPLAGFSAVLVVVGVVILSRSAGFLIMATAAFCALLAAISGDRVTRVAALILLAVSAGFAVPFYTDFRNEQERLSSAKHRPTQVHK